MTRIRASSGEMHGGPQQALAFDALAAEHAGQLDASGGMADRDDRRYRRRRRHVFLAAWR